MFVSLILQLGQLQTAFFDQGFQKNLKSMSEMCSEAFATSTEISQANLNYHSIPTFRLNAANKDTEEVTSNDMQMVRT